MFVSGISPIFIKNQKVSFKANRSASKDVKVSVVMPIYNQERYLPAALDSLQRQTLENAEFICVNDGSDATKDSSLKILRDYARKDKRIKIIDQTNQGAGPARNNGIRAAIGEYLAFLDPDDTFEDKALEVLYKKAKGQNCDMVVFNYRDIIEETGAISQPFNVGQRLQNGANIKIGEQGVFNWLNIKPVVFNKGMLWMAWNKIYDRDFVNRSHLHFTKSSLAEDNVFVFGATLNADRIGYLDQCLYNHLKHEGSAVTTTSKKNLCIFQAKDSVKRLLRELGLTEELKEQFDYYVKSLIDIHKKQIPADFDLKGLCQKRLSPEQFELLKLWHVF